MCPEMVRASVPAAGRRRGRRRHRATTVLVVLLVASMALVAGCGKRKVLFTGQEETVTTPTTTADLQSLLPSSIQSTKVIKVGSDISYPPMESFAAAGQAPQGVDVDIANALGAKLGVQFTFENAKFEGLVAGLVARKYDVVISAMKDTSARRDLGVDFVDYFQAGFVIIVQRGNPKKISAYSDLCGRQVGLQKGTPQEELAKSLVADCAAHPVTGTTRKGQVTTTAKPTTTTAPKPQSGSTTTVKGAPSAPRLIVQTFTDDGAALAALRAGTTVADIDELPVAANAVLQQPTAFDLVGEQLQLTPYGIAVRNDDVQLRAALVAAMKAVVADGSYLEILQRWRVPQGAISDVGINGG